MYRYPERCPHCNNILNSDGVCPSCQYRNILTIDASDGIQEVKAQRSTGEQTADVAKGALSIRLTTSAAKQIQQQKFNNYRLALFPEDEKIRNRDAAERWIRNYLYEKIFRVYIYNGGKGREGDDLISIRIATDVDIEFNKALSHEINSGTLVLTGTIIQRDGGYRANRGKILLLTEVSCDSPEAGQYDQVMCLPVDLFFTENSDIYEFDRELLSWVSSLPDSELRKNYIREKISHWSTYLQILEKNLPNSEYKVAYRYIRPGSKKQEYQFFLKDSASLPWKKIERSVGGSIHLRALNEKLFINDDDINGSFRGNGKDEQTIKLGTIEDIDKSKQKIIVLLDERLSRRIDLNSF